MSAAAVTTQLSTGAYLDDTAFVYAADGHVVNGAIRVNAILRQSATPASTTNGVKVTGIHVHVLRDTPNRTQAGTYLIISPYCDPGAAATVLTRFGGDQATTALVFGPSTTPHRSPSTCSRMRAAPT